jgi:hypothetical protein
MKQIVFLILILVGLNSCKKAENMITPSAPPEVEQPLTITTEPGSTSTFEVKDTLQLKINITSKMPSEVTYSIEVTRLDNNKVVYKLDSASKNSNLSLKIPVFQTFTQYSTKVLVVSKTKPTNTALVILNLNNDVAKNFQGYKVDPNARKLGTDYWTSLSLQLDLIINVFQNPYPGQIGGALLQIVCGDFNNDGWVDVFNPGWSFNGPRYGVGFLIWNPISKVFEDKNLFTSQVKSFGGNQDKTVPVYLNNDNYVDLVIFDSGDEGIPNSPAQPIRLALSNGKGEYELKEIESSTPLIKQGGGDVGDLNNDGYPELVVASGPVWFLLWGIPNFPYFSTSNMGVFHCSPQNHLGFKNNNGFGEAVSEISQVHGIVIKDFNKDGWKDLIFGSGENINGQPYPSTTRIILNLGKGRFNKNSIIQLPYYDSYTPSTPFSGYATTIDFADDDINGDGLNDLICLNTFMDYKNWDLFAYIQQPDKSFKVDKTIFKFNFPKKGNWKARLVYADYNNDGKKDVGYINDASMNKNEPNNVMGFKTVFIREGNVFVEKDYFQYDPYANYLKKTFLK